MQPVNLIITRKHHHKLKSSILKPNRRPSLRSKLKVDEREAWIGAKFWFFSLFIIPNKINLESERKYQRLSFFLPIHGYILKHACKHSLTSLLPRNQTHYLTCTVMSSNSPCILVAPPSAACSKEMVASVCTSLPSRLKYWLLSTFTCIIKTLHYITNLSSVLSAMRGRFKHSHVCWLHCF